MAKPTQEDIDNIMQSVQSAYMDMAADALPTGAANNYKLYITVWPGGEVTSGCSASVAYNADEYYHRRPHSLTCWYNQPVYDVDADTLEYDSEKNVYVDLDGNEHTPRSLADNALAKRWANESKDFTKAVTEWARRNWQPSSAE